MPAAVLDTTVLSNFAHIRRPDLLHLALGADVYTTPMVLVELRTGEALGLVPRCNWRRLQLVTLSEEEQRLADSFGAQLDAGESACLAVAKKRAWVFLTDDFAARRLAQSEDVTVSGTIGVLRQLVVARRLTIDEADSYLAVMLSHGYRAPIRSLREL
jgi:predicted nucleic acid-binding protein